MGKLITEEFVDVEYLTEDVGGEKHRYVHGIFLQSEVKNRNGRIYPKALLDREVDRYNREYVRTGRALGELSHPDKPIVDPDRVSHRITELYPDGNDYIGKARILDTPKGTIIQNILDGGGQIGVSTRGVGSLAPKNGVQMVGNDYRLITVDAVLEPSAPDAFVQGIMENKEWVFENGEWNERQYETARTMLKEASREEIEGVALKLFENYISKLSS